MENTLQNVNDGGNGMEMARFTDIMQSAPAVLSYNRQSADNCVRFGRNLLENERQAGMTPALDEQMARFIVKARKTLEKTNEMRKPFTVLLDEVKKRFTAAENDIKGIQSEVQARRNEYATRLAEEKAREEREAEARRMLEEERIRVRKELEAGLRGVFLERVVRRKKEMMEYASTATRSDIEAREREVQSYHPDYTDEAIRGDIDLLRVPSRMVSEAEQEAMKRELLALPNTRREEYNDELELYKTLVLERFAERRKELDEMERADEAKRKEMEALQARRRQEEEERLRKEQAEAEAKARQEAEVRAQAAKLKNTIDTQASLFAEPKRNDKEAFRVKVSHPAGYMLLAQMWFEDEGKDMPLEKFEKVTFKRIAAWAEKVAGEKRVESPFVEYETVHVAR